MNNIFENIDEIFDLNSRTNKISYIRNISEIDFNVFENAVNKIELDLNIEINKLELESSKLNKNVSNYVKENNNIPTDEDIAIFDEIQDFFIDQHTYMEYLTSLSEMKIVYMFKTLEINIKTLIKTAYPKIDIKKFYQWENMVFFFNSKNIKITDLRGYQEVVELKKLNNCIKHTNLLSEEIKKINEFRSLEYFDSDSITAFYERIKGQIKVFFKELTNLVIQDLFDFDSKRIEQLSNEYSNRMDKDMLNAFIESLKRRIK